MLRSAVVWAGSQRGWWQIGREWSRTFDQFDPVGSPYCTVLYEAKDLPQALCLIEVFDDAIEAPSLETICVPDAVLGCLRLSRFPWDATLPALPGLLTDADHAHVLRYRPHKRCTLRVSDRRADDVHYAKIFSDARGEAIHREGVLLWAAASRGELGFQVAEPMRWDATTNTLWQKAVKGAPVVEQLFSHSGYRLAERIGRACASITRSSLRPALQFGPDLQLERTRRYARELATRIPTLAKDIDGLLAELAQIHAQVGKRPLRPIHGAPHAHQWLDTGSQLGLVDFDRISCGDPELDAATFIAEMDFEDPHHVPIDDLNQAFLHGYESIAGSLDKALLMAYRAHKRLAKALKASRRVRLDARTRAIRHLRRAKQCLKADLT